MDTVLRLLHVLPAADWIAFALFFPAWAGYAMFARRRVGYQPSILASTNRVRRQWMLQTTYREVRVVDGVVIQNLSTSPSFFASTTILIIGGLLAVLGTADKASELARELPFAARTTRPRLRPEAAAAARHLRLRVLPLHLVDAAVHLRRAARRRGAGSVALPRARACRARPSPTRPAGSSAWRPRPSTTGCARYYFSFAAIGWFFSPFVFMAATLGVV